MLLLLIFLSLIGPFCLNENGSLTKQPIRIAAAIAVTTLAFTVALLEFGALRGFFVLLGLFSLTGTCTAFLPTKIKFKSPQK